jgi:regulator of sigma E protease
MTILYAAVLLGILIFVHELGHFLFAKILGVKVEKFSLGFGPRIVGKTFGETEYRISAFPLGGYVKMLGEEPGEELAESERARAFNYQPVCKRVGIVFAGPLFNIVFACILFVLLFMTGVPALYPDVGKIEKNSPAEKAGLMTGDRVLRIDGKAVKSWDDLQNAIDEHAGKTLLFDVRRGNEVVEVSVTPEEKKELNVFGQKKEFWGIGISPLVYPVVGEVMPGTPAEKAGLRKGDRLLQVEDAQLRTWEDMTDVIHGSAGKPLKFRIKRGTEVFDKTITPEVETVRTPQGGEKRIGLIGIRPVQNDFLKTFGPGESLVLGVKRTWDISVFTVVSLEKLIERVIPAKTIGGPILIVQMAGQQASQGAPNFFIFMAVISINLGVLNILPIPVLDGGHLLFLTIEAVRKKPISEGAVAMAQKVGLALLISIMVFALYNDIMRLITGRMIP